MVSKYYTPELSEFHIGFEVEKLVKKDIDNNEAWEKEVLTQGHLAIYYSQWPLPIHRVKYLDKQDIEDCGFECYEDVVISDDGHVFGKFKKSTRNNILWKIHFFGSFTQLKIECFQDTSLSIRERPMKEWDFTANMMVIIKNINELKKLLTQLGI